jgi:DNA-directed RNA polymerase specialized sigma subunit
MDMDGDLLRRYAESGSEEAFAELVRRHLNLVFSAALRQVNGDAQLAQEDLLGSCSNYPGTKIVRDVFSS